MNAGALEQYHDSVVYSSAVTTSARDPYADATSLNATRPVYFYVFQGKRYPLSSATMLEAMNVAVREIPHNRLEQIPLGSYSKAKYSVLP